MDLFACEAYTWDRVVPYHLGYRTLCEHVDELRAGRWVLTHMGPTMLARLPDAQHQAAADGLVIQVATSS